MCTQQPKQATTRWNISQVKRVQRIVCQQQRDPIVTLRRCKGYNARCTRFEEYALRGDGDACSVKRYSIGERFGGFVPGPDLDDDRVSLAKVVKAQGVNLQSGFVHSRRVEVGVKPVPPVSADPSRMQFENKNSNSRWAHIKQLTGF
jgi:hypothetical protein